MGFRTVLWGTYVYRERQPIDEVVSGVNNTVSPKRWRKKSGRKISDCTQLRVLYENSYCEGVCVYMCAGTRDGGGNVVGDCVECGGLRQGWPGSNSQEVGWQRKKRNLKIVCSLKICEY